MIQVVQGEAHHAAEIAADIRPGDAAELAAIGASPIDGIRGSQVVSSAQFVALENGHAIAGWGVIPETFLGNHKATLWCLTANSVLRHRKLVLSLARNFVLACQQDYEILEAYVDVKYLVAQRWLLWLGFVPGRSFQLNGVTFIVMERLR